MDQVRTGTAAFMAIWVCLLVGGCKNPDGSWKTIPLKKEGRSEDRIAIPPDVRGTVAEVCTLVSAAAAPISKWGVVVGLGKNGSSEVPPELKNDLVKYLKGQIRIGRATFDTGNITVMEFLQDRDTAIVQVEAIIPSGAPKGTHVDVLVTAPPQTQTVSLEGGLLLPVELTWERGAGGARGRYLKPLGRAEGALFVNPFLDPNRQADQARFRRARVLGGAQVLEDMPIRLQLREPDYLTCNVLQRRINERFGARDQQVAEAKTRYYLDIHIPREDTDDYVHFLELLMHLPRRSGPGVFEAHADRIARAMTAGGANHDSLALVWEAMGRSVLPVVQKLYSSTHAAVAYYSARTGLRLGDRHLAGPIVIRSARQSGGTHQLAAIAELGRHRSLFEAGEVLRELLNDRSELVRIAAYEALLQRGDRTAIHRHEVDKGIFRKDEPSFTVDVVDSHGDFVVYVTRTAQPKIVLFGRNIPLANPLFYNDPQNVVSIFSKPALTDAQIQTMAKSDIDAEAEVLRRDHVVVYRKLTGTDQISKKYRIDFKVWPLIRVLGSRPRPDVETATVPGLGLTYSQVVGILRRLCRDKSIHAKFVLQRLPQLHKIYEVTPTKGRPDVREDE